MPIKTVTFSDDVLFFPVPYHDDCRMGTWKIDSDRFQMRIIAFEPKFRLVLANSRDRAKVKLKTDRSSRSNNNGAGT